MSDRQYFVDLPMLNRFTAYHRKKLKLYGRMLDAIQKAFLTLFYDAVKGTNTSIEAVVVKIDKIAANLVQDDSYGTGDKYLMVNDFLDGLRCVLTGKGSRFQDIEFKNDHSIVENVISGAALQWEELRKQYGDDARSVIKIFANCTGNDKGARFPEINTLYALLAAEYARAREILLAQPELPQ